MSTYMQEAQDLLYGKDGIGASNFKLYPGTNRDATDEQMAEQVVRAINQVSSGDFIDVTNTDD